MLAELLKAILIGILASAPVGPVSVLVMQKSFCHGRMAGLAAGAGSAIVDTFFAVASLFAFMVVSDFFSRHEQWIFIGGGILVVVLGIFMLRRKPMVTKILVAETSKSKAVQYALQGAGCCLANPGAIAYMFALVTLFRLDVGTSESPVWLISLFVLLGALIWWFSLAFAADKLRERFNIGTINRVTKFAGYAVIGFGIMLVVRGLFLL
ncbi:MAG: LysE family transporter [Bacteroidales bacterium]|nr:LysE family transporter [Bacteroidales bacterium]